MLLRCELRNLDHPYKDNPACRREAWGHLSIYSLYEEVHEDLVNIDYNLETLALWYSNYSETWCIESLPTLPHESLAEAMNRLTRQAYKAFDKNNEEEFQQLIHKVSSFNEGHAWHSAMPGLLLPTILIGCNRGIGEISMDLGGDHSGIKDLVFDSETLKLGTWSYRFDMDDFKVSFYIQIMEFLHAWLETTSFNEGKEEAKKLITLLKEKSKQSTT